MKLYELPIGASFCIDFMVYTVLKQGQTSTTVNNMNGETLIMGNYLEIHPEQFPYEAPKPQKDKELGKFKQHLYRVTIARKLVWERSRLEDHFYARLGDVYITLYDKGNLHLHRDSESTVIKFEKLWYLVNEIYVSNKLTTELTKILEKM